MLLNQSFIVKSKDKLKGGFMSGQKSYMSGGQKSGQQTSKNLSPEHSKSGSVTAYPELAIDQRRISAVNLIIRNRKKDSLDDNS